MGRADYLSLGDWNAVCFRCGRKRKASTMKKQWQGFYVCPEHWEPRHPQDFVRGVKENPSVPWSQPAQIQFVYPTNNTSAIAGIAISGLAIAGTGGNLNPPGTTNFIDGQTLIQSSWLNYINAFIFSVLPSIDLSISLIESDLDIIESPGFVTDSRVSNVGFEKFVNKPTTLAGYGITGGGTLLNVRVFGVSDSGTVYVPTTGTNKVIVETIGGGGAGSSCASTSSENISIGVGGSAGAYAMSFFTSGFDGVTITVGGGGTASKTDLSIGAGQQSSFGTLVTAPGGKCSPSCDVYRPNPSAAFPFSHATPPSTTSAVSGDPTGAKVYSYRGLPGKCGWGRVSTGAVGGTGASSKYGRGGIGSTVSGNNGGTAYGKGSGGGSSWVINNSTTGFMGGDGAPGAVIVWEYA